MKTNHLLFSVACLSLLVACTPKNTGKKTSGNPIFPGWYADPEGIVFGDEYWIYPTLSLLYGEDEEIYKAIWNVRPMPSIRNITCRPTWMPFLPRTW